MNWSSKTVPMFLSGAFRLHKVTAKNIKLIPLLKSHWFFFCLPPIFSTFFMPFYPPTKIRSVQLLCSLRFLSCAMDKVPYKVLCAWTKCRINALQVFLISYSQSLYKSLGNWLPKNNLWEVCYQTPLGFL